eukprot:365445-Chlamydomonas_euryale.AAC.22
MTFSAVARSAAAASVSGVLTSDSMSTVRRAAMTASIAEMRRSSSAAVSVRSTSRAASFVESAAASRSVRISRSTATSSAAACGPESVEGVGLGHGTGVRTPCKHWRQQSRASPPHLHTCAISAAASSSVATSSCDSAEPSGRSRSTSAAATMP